MYIITPEFVSPSLSLTPRWTEETSLISYSYQLRLEMELGIKILCVMVIFINNPNLKTLFAG